MSRARRHTSIRDLVVAAFLTLGIIWFLYLIWGIVEKEERARADVRETEAQLASLLAREATLTTDLDALATPRGKEAALRETRGVARAGEEVIIVVPNDTPVLPPPSPSWWQRVLDWF